MHILYLLQPHLVVKPIARVRCSRVISVVKELLFECDAFPLLLLALARLDRVFLDYRPLEGGIERL